jgi:DNA invertase Pin-like site-specific DNA recombinase
MRFAFYGRVSTEDAQDPSLSLPRQLAACERAVQTGVGEIVAFYWDIESGRKQLADRGQGADGDHFGVRLRRDGGLPQLLAATTNGRGFDAVIVESIDRLSRMTADATRIERDLEQRDVGLFAADEPMTANATSILTRRVKQGVAEWYVRDLIEKSRRGMEESVRQGWHTGGPAPYGYLLEPHPHPNPQKAKDGRKKHRLVLDPVKAGIVRMIFEDYCISGLGLGAICDKLNADLDRYPPPTRNKKDENDLPQTWSRSQLQAMLRNPKYTGFNVWGRHDKRAGRPFIRPREQWIWSPTPSHEAIVSRELFEQVEERALGNHRKAVLATPKDYVQRNGRRSGRLYPLRGRIRCGICGRRMEGSHQKGANWYRCQFVYKRGLAAADAAGHPRVLGIREELILDPLFDFLGRRLFGPDRLRLLREELAQSLGAVDDGHHREIATMRRRLSEIDQAVRRQALRLEEHDNPKHPVVAAAKARIEELAGQRAATADELRRLEARRSDAPRPEEVETLLNSVPDLRPALRRYDEAELAELFDAFDVTVTYDKPSHALELAATVTAEFAPARETLRPLYRRSQDSDIAGAGFEPATSGL